jgi:hypothetical protein
MNKPTIITNGHERPLVSLAELPPTIAKEFDYVAGEDCFSPRFVAYRGEWYDTSDLMAIDHSRNPPDRQFAGWHACHSDSYFSGTLFRWTEDFEYVIVGRYYE